MRFEQYIKETIISGDVTSDPVKTKMLRRRKKKKKSELEKLLDKERGHSDEI